jgi:hypothetical protein
MQPLLPRSPDALFENKVSDNRIINGLWYQRSTGIIKVKQGLTVRRIGSHSELNQYS